VWQTAKKASLLGLLANREVLDCGQSLGFLESCSCGRLFWCWLSCAVIVVPYLSCFALVVLWFYFGPALVLVLAWSWFGPGLAVVLVLPWSWSCLGPVQFSFASPNLLLVFVSVSFCVHHKFIVVLFYIYI
jgi:hypothetical protein